MDVLITGNDAKLALSLADTLSQKHKVVLCVGDLGKQPTQHNIKIFNMKSDHDKFEHLFKTYSFHTVIFLSGRQNRMKESCRAEMEDLNRALKISAEAKGVAQFLYITWPFEERSREASFASLPQGVENEAAIFYAQENLCLSYRQKEGLNALVLYVPYIFDKGYVDLISKEDFISGKSIFLPGKEEEICDFLSALDLGHLILRMVDEPYGLEEGKMSLKGGNEMTFGEFGATLQRLLPKRKVSISDKPCLHPHKIPGEDAKKYYDWVPVNHFSESLSDILVSYGQSKKENPHFWQKPAQKRKSQYVLIPLVELVAGFFLVELLNKLTYTNAQFQFIDFRLLYVVLIGTIHGIKFGVSAAFLACISYVLGYLKTDLQWEIVFYNISNWLPFVLYIVTGAVTGHSRDKRLNREIFLQNENQTLLEKYEVLYHLYEETLGNKNQFMNQLIGYRDSFGRVYHAVKRLDSLQNEEVFLNAVQILEDILENHSVAIYTVDASIKFARLAASSEKIGEQLQNTLKLEDHPKVQGALQEQTLWCNTQFTKGSPIYCAPILDKGIPVAMILLWSASYEQMGDSYLNLLKVLSGLVESALVRAANYQMVTQERRYLKETKILNQEAYEAIIQIKKKMKDKNIAKYQVFYVQSPPEDIKALDQILQRNLRDTDFVGEIESGKYAILLSQADDKSAQLVLERLKKEGILCTLEKL